MSVYCMSLRPGSRSLALLRKTPRGRMQASKQALPHRLAWGTWPAQSHSNLTYTNAGGISEYKADSLAFLLNAGLTRTRAPTAIPEDDRG